jgi:UPF0755 protein
MAAGRPAVRRRVVLALALVTVAVLAGAGLAVLAARAWYRAPIAALTAPTTVEVAAGQTLSSVAEQLRTRGLIDRPRTWSAFARLEGKATRLRAGEYAVEPGATPASLLDLLVSGRVVLHPMTIVDGWTFAQALAAVRATPAVRHVLDGATPAEIMARLGRPGVHPEGQLFPDTYLVARGTTDLEVLAQAHGRLEKELASAWAERAEGLPLADAYQALILASIVEKETGAPEERPRIAGVFVNRLRLGMRLQTDPTVIYGLGEQYDGNIRKRDLLTDTPYNTYTRGGLPPTPISLPGRAALRAATRPDATDALYFVASGLGDGRHVFSASYAEHDRAVHQYLVRLRAGSGARAPAAGTGVGAASGDEESPPRGPAPRRAGRSPR